MKVIFIYPDINAGVDTPNASTAYRSESKLLGGFNEGISQLASILQQRGDSVKLLHYTKVPTPETIIRDVKNADLIAFSSNTFMFPYVQKWSNLIIDEEENIPMLLGGVHATLVPHNAYKESSVNAVNIGEGDLSLPKVCESIENGNGFNNIGNVFVGKSIPEMLPLADLDELPFPDRSIWDYNKLFSSQSKTLRIMISRGCPYNCHYCSEHILRSVSAPNSSTNEWVRFMSPRHAVDYIKHALTQFDCDNINFNDTILPLRKQWMKEFLPLYRDEVALPFSCRMRPNIVTKETCKELKDTGCTKIIFGVETGSPAMNKVIGRHIEINTIVKAFRECQHIGLKTKAFVMLGLPDETVLDIQKTIKLLATLKSDEIVGTIFCPLPHTKLYDYCIKKGYIPNDFSPGVTNLFQKSLLKMPQISSDTIKFLHDNLRTLISYEIIMDINRNE